MTSDIDPQLPMPASFDRARKLSLVIVLLFDIALWAWFLMLAALPVALLFFLPLLARHFGAVWAQYSGLVLGDLSIGRRLVLIADFAVAMVPNLFIFLHARRLFAGLARGNIFTESTIAHLRALGFWLIVSVLLGVVVQSVLFGVAEIRHVNFNLNPQSLLYGAMIYVAAYVMAEARRIAADNAEIV